MTATRSVALTSLFIMSFVACSSADEPGDPPTSEDPTLPGDPTATASPTTPEVTPTATSTSPVEPPPTTDPCDGRVASSSVPCSSDPDPCGLNSGFPGDEYCILPPPAGEGIQIHFGPKDYRDPAEIAKYAMEAGAESNSYGIAHIPNTEDRWFDYVQIRMRPGSHHLINTLVEGAPEEGFQPAGSGCPGTSAGFFPGTQNLIFDSPPNGEPAPENVGLGRQLLGNTSLCLNYHGYNYTEETALREVWINVWFVDEAEVTQRASGIFVLAGPFSGIPPNTQQTLTQTAQVDGTGRIISLFGHRHAWTDRFAVWHNDNLIYDSWSWEESVVYNYDSLTQNPALNPDAKTDGAVSGVLEVNPGDQLRIQCDINNGSDQTLFFRNALYEGEMCILFGSAVGVSIR